MAIAFDATTTSSYTAGITTLTYSHTFTGSNGILYVATANSGAPVVNTVTYNGVGMTEVQSVLTNTNGSKLRLWQLIGPSTGANNVVVTLNSAGNVISKCVSYTGVAQSGQPDSSSATGPVVTSSFSTSTTTVADNTWCIMAGMGMNGSTLTAGSNTTVRSQIEVLLAGLFIVDTNSAQTPAGSKTVTVTSASQQFHGIMASFSPFVPVSSQAGILYLFCNQ